jgi:hypothetical protein
MTSLVLVFDVLTGVNIKISVVWGVRLRSLVKSVVLIIIIIRVLLCSSLLKYYYHNRHRHHRQQ